MKIFIVFFVLSFTLLSNAIETDALASPAAQTEAKASVPQNGTAAPPGSLLIMPDGPEKQKRIKKLEKQMLGTVGWTTGRWGFLSLHRWPRADRLYTLHNKLTDSDWMLLAEMYINFSYSRKDYRQKELGYLESAMTVLLAMCGQDAIDILSNIIESKKISEDWKVLLYSKVRHVKEALKIKYWSILPEYKSDQEKACAAGEMFACTNLGRLYERGEGVKQDYPKAKELYEKACVTGEMLACTGLGRLYDSGNGVEQDAVKAKELYEKICGTSIAACSAIGDSYRYGRTVKYDAFKAMEYYEKACNTHHAKSCKKLGEFYFQGWGVEQDYAKAKEYYKKACDLGNQDACYEYKRLNEQ